MPRANLLYPIYSTNSCSTNRPYNQQTSLSHRWSIHDHKPNCPLIKPNRDATPFATRRDINTSTQRCSNKAALRRMLTSPTSRLAWPNAPTNFPHTTVPQEHLDPSRLEWCHHLHRNLPPLAFPRLSPTRATMQHNLYIVLTSAFTDKKRWILLFSCLWRLHFALIGSVNTHDNK